jgi:hypothetical protein
MSVAKDAYIVDQELNKHAKVEQGKRSAALDDHVKRLAAIQKLMAADSSFSFDEASTQVCRDEAAAVSTSEASRKEATMLVGPADRLMICLQRFGRLTRSGILNRFGPTRGLSIGHEIAENAPGFDLSDDSGVSAMMTL